MQNSILSTNDNEFMCPDCGHLNAVSVEMLTDKYHEHQIQCIRCGHLLEVVIADGLSNRINIIASSVDSQ